MAATHRLKDPAIMNRHQALLERLGNLLRRERSNGRISRRELSQRVGLSSTTLSRIYPAQQRRRDVFHALQAVNANGHRWDVFVKWEDGTIGRPVMVGFQDLFSDMILSWRIDKSENAETVRLAFGDMVETYGIPKMCYLDNGRNFASKWMNAGIKPQSSAL
ncbi:transposase domain-containing protein [Gluconobacter morbifer]|nr:transposase domain-containing protein [Gluconobacter morbifer]